MPIQTGLYCALIPPLLFALLGSSRRLIVGADSATAALVAAGAGAAVTPESSRSLTKRTRNRTAASDRAVHPASARVPGKAQAGDGFGAAVVEHRPEVIAALRSPGDASRTLGVQCRLASSAAPHGCRDPKSRSIDGRAAAREPSRRPTRGLPQA